MIRLIPDLEILSHCETSRVKDVRMHALMNDRILLDSEYFITQKNNVSIYVIDALISTVTLARWKEWEESQSKFVNYNPALEKDCSTYVRDLYIILFFWLAGEVLPWIILRSRGIKLSFWEHNHPIIRESFIAINHKNKVFDALQVIQRNRLDRTIDEIAGLI